MLTRKKKWTLFIVSIAVLITALVLAGCGKSSSGGGPAAIKPTFTVSDGAGVAVVGAKVYAIPAADVAALAATPLDSSATGNYSNAALAADEPLEDLIRANGAAYNSATTDSTGKAVLSDNLPASDFFIYVEPANSDYLPGGDICREAKPGSSLNNKSTPIEVSSAPSASATFVGSSSCSGCHATFFNSMKKTMHKLGIKAMGSESGLQDKSEFTAGDFNLDRALTEKFISGDSASGGTTIYFYDYDGTRKFDKFKTLESQPTGTVYATVRIYKDTTDQKYKAQFTNVINPDDLNSGMIHEVKMSYGGGVYKQRYMTTIGDSTYLIPLQFNQRGDDASPDRVRKIWRDYHMDWWVGSIVSNVSMTFKDIQGGGTPSKTFDAECAACHFNGFTYDAAKKQATAVADSNGETHPVTGAKQELNIGCETCHGPGSDHVNAGGGRGKKIVNPRLITPERAGMICGQCHSRPQGKGTWGANDAPVDANNKMMIAGTSRQDFLANQTSRHDAADSAGDYWGDSAKHSKSHHQQYTDFIRSSKYRNGTKLLTCASCHNPHGPGTDRHQLSGISDNSKCQSCHTDKTDINAHMTAMSMSPMVGSATKCIECHITKTSTSGAGNNPTNYVTGGTSGTKYYQGDISSHLFDVPLKTSISSTNAMPIPYTNRSCTSTCHGNGTISGK